MPDQIKEALDAAEKQVGAHCGALRGLGLALKGNLGQAQGDIRRIVVRSFAAAAAREGPD